MSAPIEAFVGLNGSGKTLAAVELVALPAMESGRLVYSNLELFHPNWRPLVSWRNIPRLRNCVLLVDEVTAALPSRQSQSMPPELARVLNQLRKVDVQVAWTAPTWARADKMLREVTGRVTVCRGLLSDRWERDDAGKRTVRVEHAWKPNRLFRWVTYAGEDFDEFTFSAQRKLKPVGRRWYWRPRHQAHKLYATLDQVDLLDHLDYTGVCPICDGSRRRHHCKCAGPEHAGGVEDRLIPIELGVY